MHFLVQGRTESADDLAGTEEPPGLKKGSRKMEASSAHGARGSFWCLCKFWD